MLNKNVLSKFLSCTLLLSGIILFTSFAASAATYYVATDGDNSRTKAEAQVSSTPWLTIDYAADQMQAGDICKIKGGTYRETVTPLTSGNNSSKITFMNFDSNPVIIDGTDILSNTGWIAEGSLYKHEAGSLPFGSGNELFVNDVLYNDARWPNNTGTLFAPTLAVADAGTATTITDADLSQDWTGAKLWCLPGDEWSSDVRTITGYNAQTHTITFDALTLQPAKQGTKYYISMVKSALDYNNEWWYDGSLGKAYLNFNPSTSVVKVRKRVSGFDLSGKSYIDIKGINFFATGLYTDANTTNCTFDNITAKYTMNGDAEHGGINLYGSNLVLKNSTIQYSSRTLVNIKGTSNSVINCLLQYGDYSASADPIVKLTGGSGHLISDNTISEAGRACLGGRDFSSSQIQYNNMFNAGRMTRDLGIIYIANTDGVNTRVHHNLVHDNVGLGYASGIYYDNFTSNFITDHNVVWGVSESALVLNTPNNNMLAYNNTFVGGNYSVKHWGETYYINDMYGARVFNNICGSNMLVAGGTVRGNNLYSGTNPLYDSTYHLTNGSPAINTGVVLSGITDGAVGTPDIGAYEYTGTDWIAGHNFTTPPNHTFTTISAPYMNLVKNPGFETGLLTPWTGMGGNYSVVNEPTSAWNNPTGMARAQYYGLRLGGTAGQNDGIIQTVSVLPNTTYVLSAWLKSSGAGTESVEIGVSEYGGVLLNVKTYSTSWDQRSLEFTTGSTNTTAKVYLWKNTTGSDYVYADAIALTTKDSNTKADSFENGFGAWIYSTVPTIGTIVHGTGTKSYKIVADNDYIKKPVNNLYNKIASVWFYDYATVRDDTMCVLARIDDNVIAKGIGVNTAVSTANYVFLNGSTFTDSLVPRRAGWHEFKFDYSSGDGLKMYIDNIPTNVSISTDVKAFSWIRLGDMWSDSKTCTDSYFDDFTIQDIDTIQ
jgi:hypothetical protein